MPSGRRSRVVDPGDGTTRGAPPPAGLERERAAAAVTFPPPARPERARRPLASVAPWRSPAAVVGELEDDDPLEPEGPARPGAPPDTDPVPGPELAGHRRERLRRLERDARRRPPESRSEKRTCPPLRIATEPATVPVSTPLRYVRRSPDDRSTRWSPVAWFVRKRSHRSTRSERIVGRAASGAWALVPRSPKRIGHGVWGLTRSRRVRASWQRKRSGCSRCAWSTLPMSTSRGRPTLSPGR